MITKEVLDKLKNDPKLIEIAKDDKKTEMFTKKKMLIANLKMIIMQQTEAEEYLVDFLYEFIDKLNNVNTYEEFKFIENFLKVFTFALAEEQEQLTDILNFDVENIRPN